MLVLWNINMKISPLAFLSFSGVPGENGTVNNNTLLRLMIQFTLYWKSKAT